MLFARYAPRGAKLALRWTGIAAATAALLFGAVQGYLLFQDLGGLDGVRDRIYANTVYSDPEMAADPTKRYASLDAAARLELWKVALDNWRKHPFTGTGGDTYQVVYAERKPEGAGDVLHPHSMWMSLLSDTGLFACLAYAAFCAGLFVLATRNAFSVNRSRRSRSLIAGPMAASAAYLISSSIDWNWYIPAATLPFFALAAVACGTRPGAAIGSGNLCPACAPGGNINV